MKPYKFRKPNNAELRSIKELIERRRSGTEHFINQIQENETQIAVFNESDKAPFTTVIVKLGEKMFVGTSKRNRYGQTADPYNSKIGFDVALSRAAKTNPIDLTA